MENARILSRALEGSGYYKVVSEIHHPYEAKGATGLASKALDAAKKELNDPGHYKRGLPVVSFR